MQTYAAYEVLAARWTAFAARPRPANGAMRPGQSWRSSRHRTAVKPSPNLRKTTSPDPIPIRCSKCSRRVRIPGFATLARTVMLKPRVDVEVCSAPRSPTTGCDGVGLRFAEPSVAQSVAALAQAAYTFRWHEPEAARRSGSESRAGSLFALGSTRLLHIRQQRRSASSCAGNVGGRQRKVRPS